MAASNSKGVVVYLLTGSATPDAMTPTSASSADPSNIEVSSTPAGLGDSWVVNVPSGGTSLPELDDLWWPVGNVSGDTFDLVGSDTSDTAGTFVSTEDMLAYDLLTDFVPFCLSTLEFNPETPTTVSAGTFCDPSQTVSSATTSAGTATIGGYIDITAPDYAELLAWDADGGSRVLVADLPNNGKIIMEGELGPVTFGIPLDGALSWNATLVLNSKPRHLF